MDIIDRVTSTLSELEALRAENKLLLEALEWYAEDANYLVEKVAYDKNGSVWYAYVPDCDMEEVARKALATERVRAMVKCYDCGLEYGSTGWIDALVSDDIWRQISPHNDGTGILCINCISKRCEERGLDNIPVALQSGTLVNGTVTGVRPIVVATAPADAAEGE